MSQTEEDLILAPEGEEVGSAKKLFEALPWYAKWVHLNFPRLAKFAKGVTFESIMGGAIVYNCITIGISVHLCPPDTSMRSREDCPQVFLTLSEHLCTLAFLLEWLVRGLCYGFLRHFQSVNSCSDTFLVWIAGVLLTWIVEPLFGTGGQMRLLTVLRAFRLLRVVRVARFKLKEMWHLLKGLAMSFKTLLSAIFVFVFVNYLFGILAVTLIGDSPEFEGRDETYQEVHGYFKGLDEAMFTLLQIVTGDSWASGIARPLLKIMPSLWFFFVAYFAVAGLVLMNLITAIIVDNAIQMSKDDEEQKLHEMQQESRSQLKKLESIFRAIDEDGSGEIDRAEFDRKVTKNDDILKQLQLLGFDQGNCDDMFDDLAGHDGMLTMEEFLQGLRAMCGMAKSVDIVRIENKVNRLHKRLDDLIDIMDPRGKSKESNKDATDSNKESGFVSVEPINATGSVEGMTGYDCQQGTSLTRQEKVQEGAVKSSSIASSELSLPPKSVAMATGVEYDSQLMVDAICRNIGLLIQEQLIGLKASMGEMISQQVRDDGVGNMTSRPAYDELAPFQTPPPSKPLPPMVSGLQVHSVNQLSDGREKDT